MTLSPASGGSILSLRCRVTMASEEDALELLDRDMTIYNGDVSVSVAYRLLYCSVLSDVPLPDQTKFIACTAAEQTYGHGHPKARLKISSFCRVSGAWQVPKCAEQHTSASFHTLQPHVRHKHMRVDLGQRHAQAAAARTALGERGHHHPRIH